MRALRQLRKFMASWLNDPDRHFDQGRMLWPEDFDETVASRHSGDHLQMYDYALYDAQAQTLLQKRCEAVVVRDWEVKAAADDDVSRERARRVAAELGRPGFGLDRMSYSLLHDALLYGVGAVELVWHRTKDGLWFPRAWMAVRVDRLRVDGHGSWHIRTRGKPQQGEPVQPGQLVVMRYRDAGGTWPYGRGLGATLWWLVWFKRQLLAAWLEGAERTGSPAIIGTVPSGIDAQERKLLDDALSQLRSSDYASVPEGSQVSLLGGTGSKGEIYRTLWRELDGAMAKLVLGATLTTEMGDQGGSYAAAQVHDTVGERRAQADSKFLCETLGEQLLGLVHRANWGDDGLPPMLHRDFYDPGGIESVGRALKELAGLGYTPEDRTAFARKRLGADWVHGIDARDQAGQPTRFAATDQAREGWRDRLRKSARSASQEIDTLADQALPQDPWQGLSASMAGPLAASASIDDLRTVVEEMVATAPSPRWAARLERALLAADMRGRLAGKD